MKRLAVGLLGVLLVGAATLFLAADQIVERVITAWLSDKLDRRIEVMGEFSTELGNPLRFRAKSIRLANPDWLDEPIMATASFVEAAIDLTTLPGEEPLVIEKLEIRDLNAGLVSNEKGQANWVFGNPDSTGETNFRIRDLDVIDGSLAIARAGLDRVNVSIKKLAQNADANELLRTEVVGTVNDRPVDVKGLLGPFPSLLSGKDLRVAINGTVGELQIKGYGQIDDVTAPRQPILKVEVFAPSAMEVASTFGLNFEGESTSVIDLVLDIAPLGQGVSVVGGGDWGEDRIEFKGTIDDLLELDGVQFEASGRGDDLQGSLILFGFRELPDVGYSFNGNISRNGGRADVDGLEFVVGGFEFKLDGELNSFPSLNDANLKFSVRGDDVARFRETFGLPGVAKGEFTLQGELERSPAGLDEFRLRSRTEIGRAKLFGTL
ncbi:MAG: hypothetical protein ACR2QB_02705, partial [Gammaproteobacteria bacterium]